MEPDTFAAAFATQSGENEVDILETAQTLPKSPDTCSVSNPVDAVGVKPGQTTHKPERVSVTDISPLPATTAAKDNTRLKRCKRYEVFTASPMKLLLKPISSEAGQSLEKAKKVSGYADNLEKSPEHKEKKIMRTKTSDTTSGYIRMSSKAHF